MIGRRRAPVRATALVLTVGTVLSALCFAIGFLLQVAGAVWLQPTTWSTAAVLLLLATPAVGLGASAIELRSTDPRTALVALGVLGVLAVAAIIALAGT